jgi:hypothetical protein
MFNKQNEHECPTDEQELTMSRCLKTMVQIIEAPLSAQTRLRLESYALRIFYFLFWNLEMDYMEELMGMMTVYVEKVDEIRTDLWFFYQVLIYFVVGISDKLWDQIKDQPYTEEQKQILSNLKEGTTSLSNLHLVVPTLRNFFAKCQAMIASQSEECKL